ncbi:hypothetical protein, partial [Priestia megaterium]|uniref:hypothetical protein n=1 Tax=Priestia megaterium TaxID=1404 RepID=UPI0035B651F0
YVDPRLASPVFAATSPTHVIQDQARLRLGYEFDNGWSAEALAFAWLTDQDGTDARSFLKDAAGNTVYQGKVVFNG